MNNALMFSSKSDEWSTPQDVFDRLNAEFLFDVDLAATSQNAKVPNFYTKEMDSLSISWSGDTMRKDGPACGWLNPPYSRGLCGKFISKAAEERRRGFLIVMLLPARTDTKAFHAHIYHSRKWQAREGVEIRLLPGRLKFGGCKDSAPFPSMVVVFRP
jgi:site-specific DNA-methyltransferase (adenine-specific)